MDILEIKDTFKAIQKDIDYLIDGEIDLVEDVPSGIINNLAELHSNIKDFLNN